MADAENARERFKGFVQVLVMDRPYISKPQERQLLEQGMTQFGLDASDARGIMFDAVHTSHLELERDIDRRVLQILQRDGGSVKKISRREFAAAAELYVTFSRGILSEDEARLLVKQLMEANQFRARRGGLMLSRRWYKTIGQSQKQSVLAALLNRQL